VATPWCDRKRSFSKAHCRIVIGGIFDDDRLEADLPTSASQRT
jgi:hypothetical protein